MAGREGTPATECLPRRPGRARSDEMGPETAGCEDVRAVTRWDQKLRVARHSKGACRQHRASPSRMHQRVHALTQRSIHTKPASKGLLACAGPQCHTPRTHSSRRASRLPPLHETLLAILVGLVRLGSKAHACSQHVVHVVKVWTAEFGCKPTGVGG
eukprot:363272-Chlamydomonas_euryale.AAC.6